MTNETDLVSRTTALETTSADHEKRIASLETSPHAAADPGAIRPDVGTLTGDQAAKVLFILDKYFPHENPPVENPSAAPVAGQPAAV